MEGAINAVREMLECGFEVFFCTAPHPLQYETCVAEKYAWVRKYVRQLVQTGWGFSRLNASRVRFAVGYEGLALIETRFRVSCT